MINTKLLKKLDIKKYKNRIIKELKTPRIYSLKSTLSTISLTYDKEKLKKFNKKYNGLNSYIKNLSEENDVLIDSYNRFKKFNSNYIEKSYRDLIGEYKDKGYKSFDFKEKQNLFKPNPLLMENKKIKNYFAFNLKKSNLPSFINKFIKRKENKYFSFLKKEESLVKEELIKHKLEKGQIVESSKLGEILLGLNLDLFFLLIKKKGIFLSFKDEYLVLVFGIIF